MVRCISFGNINKSYKYIILAVFSKIIHYCLYGLQYNNSFSQIKIISNNSQDYLSKHKFIHRLFCFIGVFFISFFLYIYKKNESDITIKKIESQKCYKPKHLYKLVFLVIFLIILVDFLLIFHNETLNDLNFWMIELLIITYISNKMFNTQTYRHQKLAILINFIGVSFKIITIGLSSINNEKNEREILYIKYLWLIPLGILIYLLLIAIESYVFSKIKYFMDKNFVSIEYLLMIFGLIGSIFYSLACIIFSYIKCNSSLKNYICLIHSDSGSENYIDNFNLYFQKFKDGIIYEIIIIILGIITFFFFYYFSLLVLKILSPIHLIFFTAIYFLIRKIILPISTLIQSEHSFFSHVHIQNIYPKYFLDFFQDIISTIGFLIYLEIIELNFYGFNYDLRKNIINRSIYDSKNNKKITQFVFMEDGDVEEISDDGLTKNQEGELNRNMSDINISFIEIVKK